MENTIHKAGRPKGSKNKSPLNKTRTFQSVFTEEKVIAMAEEAYARLMNSETTNTEFCQLLTIIAKYNFNTADTVYETDAIVEITSREQADSLMDALKKRVLSK